MSRAAIILTNEETRERAVKWVRGVPSGTRLEIKAPKRSIPQNDRMWAMLTDIARQVSYHGLRLSPEDFKLLFLDALKREVRMVPNLDGNGFVSLGRSSSDLSKAEFSDLFEVIEAWAAANGVVFSDRAAA